MSIFNISISPTNSIRVSPPVSSTIEIENPQQLSNRIINTGSRIGSYNNRSTYINHDALVLRSQLLSKNMREGTFKFTTAKFDPYAPSYITTYLTSQNINTIFYTNYFNLPQQSYELSSQLSEYNPISYNLNYQYSFIVTDEYLETGDAETLLNSIANEYANNYNGVLQEVSLILKAFTINFDKNKLVDAIDYASNDPRISQSFKDEYVYSLPWTGNHPVGSQHIICDKNSNPFFCAKQNEDTDWPRTICPFENGYQLKTRQDIIDELPPCWGSPSDWWYSIEYDLLNRPFSNGIQSFLYHHLDRLDDSNLPLDRAYGGRTKPRNKPIQYAGTCDSLKEPTYVYILDTPIRISSRFTGPNSPLENRLTYVYGPWFDNSRYPLNHHGHNVANMVAGKDSGITRKPLLIGVGVLPQNGVGTLWAAAVGLSYVIQDKIDYPDSKIIVNMSLGGKISGIGSNILENTISRAIQEGIIVIVAAGNDNMDADNFSPARLPAAITVGSTIVHTQCHFSTKSYKYAKDYYGTIGEFYDKKASYSNYGSVVDIYAPGEVISPRGYLNGTSFSSPLVAGVAAEILRYLGSNITQEQMKNILIGYAAGGEDGILGKINNEDTYGIIGLQPGRDNNYLLQNPFKNCIDMESINNFDDPDDCAENPNIVPEITILNQPQINLLQNKISINAQLLYNTTSNQQYLSIPDVGIEWQCRDSNSNPFVSTQIFGSEFDLAASSGCSQFRALISFPSITGDDWHSNENSTISDIVYVETPTPVPGFPVDIILSNFTGAAENCSNYNGTYTIYEPFVNNEPSDYSTTIEPPNSYATDASVNVGYSPNFDDVYVCLNIITPDGSSQLCQTYDVDWNTGNYAIQNGFPSTPWCIGNIALNINI